MKHAHKCGRCGRTWSHDPNTWPERLRSAAPFATDVRRYLERSALEHACCGEMWLDHWPPPWPWCFLGAAFHRDFQRRARLAVRVLAFVGGALVQLGAKMQGRP